MQTIAKITEELCKRMSQYTSSLQPSELEVDLSYVISEYDALYEGIKAVRSSIIAEIERRKGHSNIGKIRCVARIDRLLSNCQEPLQYEPKEDSDV